MLDFQYCSEDTKDLTKALIGVQKDLQPAVKDSLNPFCKNRYASLNSIMDACRQALIKNNVLLTQYPIPAENGHLALVSKLIHADTGQYQASICIIPLQKNDAQVLGSAFTYGRRYALSSMLGITAEEDDDGNAASGRFKGSVVQTKSVNTDSKSNQNRILLTTLMNELGLSDYIETYRDYLRLTYKCPHETLSIDSYNEQYKLLEQCKNNPINTRNFIQMLNNFRNN